MIITLDTSFLMLHYFSKDPEILDRSKSVLHYCKLAGNNGLLPSIVLAESFAILWKRAGRTVAEHRFEELTDSGLKVLPLSQAMAREAGIVRAKYQEKIPWGDCLITGAHIMERGDIILSEDPHFREIREIKTRTLQELKL